MHEYEVGILAGEDGGYGLDVRPAGATGSAPFFQFSDWAELVRFFASVGVIGDLLKQINEIGQKLKPGSAYHSKIFLPETVSEGLASAHEAGLPRPLPLTKAATA